MSGGTDSPASARRLTVCNQRGLHARAAAKFVRTVEQYDAEVTVVKDGVEVPGDSIMGLMMLAAGRGTSLDVRAHGPDAEAALDALATLLERGFDETQ
ncbi:phosphocarrier protein [Limimonas halophila]|uniref:Phosphocarrier protein n=1 Tax=Limimonas halophila TaxID=1082479 RepID=A0A1G7TEM9_9PROT|nr:HPr family phosphocarrier protein [Limimonas halophila]SDG33807.1 phosphocarrier protein [Limimonas halophila]